MIQVCIRADLFYFMKEYVQLTFEVKTEAEKDLLIGQLTMLGCNGFEEKPKELIAIIPAEEYDERLIQEHVTIIPRKEIIVEKNWNEEWERNFKPVIIDDFCCIRAHFHPPVTGVRHDVIITPKMSFGTGHHATTFQMVRLMNKFKMDGIRVCDFGTGTGILAILAEKLGASEIVAVDNDEWSINNAEENIRLNSCTRITLVHSDTTVELGTFDMILANINKNIILSHLSSLKQQLSKHGVLFLSGLLKDDYEVVNNEAVRNNFIVTEHSEKDKWIALVLKSRSDI